MRTSLLLIVPCLLLAGLLYGAFALNRLSPPEKPCSIGLCPFAIHQSDSGRTFTYNIAARFEVLLDESKNPKDELRCTPQGVVELRQDGLSAPPLYAASFEAVGAGTCVLSDRNFSVIIVIR